MKKLLLTLFALGTLFLTGCYESITGYKLAGEYQCPIPLGYWGDSKLSYGPQGDLNLSIALDKSTLAEFSKPQMSEVKLSGNTPLYVKNIIRDDRKSSLLMLLICSSSVPAYFYSLYDDTKLKAIAFFTEKPYLQILDPQTFSVKKEIKVEKKSQDFIYGITCSDDLQYLAIAYFGIGPLDHTIEIYKLNKATNTYQFCKKFDCRPRHHQGMFFFDMNIINNILVVKLGKGTRDIIKTSKIVFYNLENDRIESEYISKNISFVRAAALTLDHEYMIIIEDAIRLYRRTPEKKRKQK